MIFGKTKLELQVGVFVFIGLVILGVLVLMIGKFELWNGGYEFATTFNFVNGVKLGAPVRFAGVDVGEVRDVQVYFSPEESRSKVRVVVWVKNGLQIPVDSTVWVNTLGLLGEKYVEIMAGDNREQFVTANYTLTGKDPVAMHEVGELAKKVVTDIDDNIVKIKEGEGTVGRLLNDDSIYKEIEALVMDLRRHPWKLFWKTK
jgi:phospholipid/cholesterol/gamma-HCH transport system substrate-binding protein